MTSMHSRHSKVDDNMGMSTPNFFNTAWNPEEGDFSFTEKPGDLENYQSYRQTYSEGYAESVQFDYFSSRHEDQYANQQGYQAGFDLSNDDVSRILTPGISYMNMDLAPENGKALDIPSSYALSNEAQSIHIKRPYGAALVFGQDGLEARPNDQWSSSMMTPDLQTDIAKRVTKRATAVLNGQVTPGDSPHDDNTVREQANAAAFPGSESQAQSNGSTRGKRSSLASKSDVQPPTDEFAPKPAKKSRKSKKKPVSKEQEEAKRQRFLERNRVAADKCRQNRKKWIDDLQEKCHIINADNVAKKSALDEMEQELIQMKSLLLLHSQNCKDENILAWVTKESQKLTESQAAGTSSKRYYAHAPSSESQETSSTRNLPPETPA